MKEPWAQCGICGAKMHMTSKQNEELLICQQCGLLVDKGFVGQFFMPKYYGRIQKVVICNAYSAKIVFVK